VKDLAEDVVEEEPVDPAGEERPNRRDGPVDLEVVQQGAGDSRRENRGDAGEPDDRSRDVLARLGRLVRIVTQRCEDGARCLQDEQRP
jgi:hypothetical protein